MSQWMIKCATLFKPIIERLHKHLLKQCVIQADETKLAKRSGRLVISKNSTG